MDAELKERATFKDSGWLKTAFYFEGSIFKIASHNILTAWVTLGPGLRPRLLVDSVARVWQIDLIGALSTNYRFQFFKLEGCRA